MARFTFAQSSPRARRSILVGVKGGPRGRCECARLARAALDLLHEGDVAGARQLLARVLALSQGGGRDWGDGWSTRTLSQQLAQTPQRSDVALRGADIPRTLPAMLPVVVEPRQPPIRVCALGGFDLVIDGIPFVSGVKPQRRPLDLLKALLVANEYWVGAAELADKLWPDSDGDTARNSLQVAVHRLRRLLGRDEAVIVQDRKVCLHHTLCSVDLWTFEREAGHLSRAYGDEPSFAEMAIETLRLYRGPLFAHEAEQAWMLLPRERLRRVWLGLVRRLGDHYETRGEWSSASELYERAVDLDPLAEEVYRRLMRCQQRAGESAEAMHTYRCCRQQLVSALGVAPSAETERLYHALRSVA
ncbi:MAG TPA: BTAD domain-containing putative transcriptional regulator [Burkholderiales bacterium]|nr:BTAD domain-containing putative transcriptional regulator [Burkholderiales bacterium]